jgi:hypothetical protein
MTATTFDTLMYAKKLREAGVPEKQAEVQAEALKEIIENNLATKKDIEELKVSLENKLELKIKDLEYRLTVRMGVFAAAIITVLTAVIKL